MGRPPHGRVTSGAISGYVLRLVRESTGRTQIGFAEEIGVDLATVQGWESGRRPLANMKAGALLDLRRRLPALGADPALVQLLDPAMDADRIIGGTLNPDVERESHPLAHWVHDRTTAHMIAWALTGTPPPAVASRPVPRRRGAALPGPRLGAPERAAFFTNLREAAEASHRVGEAGALLRRQALYLASYDSSPGAASWTATALHNRRGVIAIRGWSPQWAEARSTATALARQGDLQPLVDFIDRAMVGDDQSEAANLNYWAYWLGASRTPQASDAFMADRELTGWEPAMMLRMLVKGLDGAPTYAELYAHSLWALVEAHPWLPLAAPDAATVLGEQADRLLDGGGLSPRSRRDLSAVQRNLRDRRNGR